MVSLDERWRDAIDGVAHARGFATTRDVARLGALVAALSARYNAEAGAARGGGRVAEGAQALAARLAFSFPRDVPKSAVAVRELVAAGLLRLPADRPLRVLDVGAGLGATTWGVAMALAEAGQRGAIDAVWTDDDAQALDLGAALVRAVGGALPGTDGALRVSARTETRRAHADVRGPFDLVLLGQVLSELDPDDGDDVRTARHVALVEGLLRATSASGSLVLVEPALRDRTRHLHRVRDALMAARAATLFAPCLHEAPCPALAAEGDWCHEDRPIDLPTWLAPVARAAGLRWQGLTFSYLVLRKDGKTLASALPEGAGRVRVVSAPRVTKGKSELFVCGEVQGGCARVRAMRLDRDEAPGNAAWTELARGDLARVAPPLDPAKPRVTRESTVTPLAPTADGAGD